MKRSGIKRRVERVQEFQDRARRNAARNARDKPRSPLRKVNPVREAKRRAERAAEGPLTPLEWRDEVWRLDGGRSVLSGARVRRRAPSAVWQAHHGIEKGSLRARGLFHLVWHPDNGMALLTGEHAAHTARLPPVPYEKVPQRCKDFAARLGPWAEDLLRRNHPPAGTSGNDQEERHGKR